MHLGHIKMKVGQVDEKKIFTSKTGYIELKEYEAQDVDTMEDWAMLEIKYNYNKQ